MTLAQFFTKRMTDAKMSLRDIAKRAKVDPSTPWKITNGRPVRAATLGRLLRALGLKETDDAYTEAFALWSTEQSQIPEQAMKLATTKSRTKHFRATEDFLIEVVARAKKVTEGDRAIVLEALDRIDGLKLWMESTRLARK